MAQQTNAVAVQRATESHLTFGEMMEQAKVLVGTGFLPKAVDTPEKAVAIGLTGQDYGYSFMQSLRMFYVINGKVSAYADGMAGMVQHFLLKAGDGLLRVRSNTDQECTVEYRRPGVAESSTYQFTMEDAKRANLLKNPTWSSYPKDMLRARALAGACRSGFQDVVAGIYDPGEFGHVIDIDGSPRPDTQDTRHIEVQGRSVDRSTGVIEATVDEPGPDDELKAAKKALWVVVHNGYGWDKQDLELVVADTYGDDGISIAEELDVEQLDRLREEVQKLPDDERDALIAMLRKNREAA